MIAPNEDITAAGSGEPAPTTTPTPTDPAAQTPASRPSWTPAINRDTGAPIAPAEYARFGATPEGLVEWAELNHTHLGIPGAYNSAVLMQAAGTMRALQDDLDDIRGCLSILRRVLEGESLLNERVKAEFREAIETIETCTVHVEIVAIATNATAEDAS